MGGVMGVRWMSDAEMPKARVTGFAAVATSEPLLSLLWQDLLATLSLSQTSIALRFVPADGSGDWSITGVYLDPYGRN